MRHMLPAACALALLLSACGGGTPPATPPAASTPAAVTAPAAPAAPVAPAAAGDLAPVVGTWADDPALCGGAAVTTIAANRFNGGGTSCDIALSVAANGDVTGNCNNVSLAITPLFAPSGEALRISIAGAEPKLVYRCSR